MKKLMALLLAAMLLFALAAGCNNDTPSNQNGQNNQNSNQGSNQNSDQGSNTPAQNDPDDGYETFSYVSGIEAFTLDCASNTEGNAAGGILALLTPPLIWRVEGEITGLAAESWDVSADGLTYTFRLKDGYKWENGDPLTAYDFQYSARRWADPATGSTNGDNLMYFIENCYEIYQEQSISDVTLLGINALDDSTLEMRLNKVCPYFIDMLAHTHWIFPLNQAFVESCGNDYASAPDKFMSCGPYKLTEWTHDSELVIEKREDFAYADSYDVDKITRVMVSDQGTAVNMYEAGEIDAIVSVGADYIDQYYDSIQFISSTATRQLIMNFDSPRVPEVLKNANFRKALSYALDREAIVSAVAGNNGTAPWSRIANPTLEDYVGSYPVESAPLGGDPAQAKAYLDAALQELGLSDVSALPQIEFALLEGSTYKSYGEALVDTWSQVLGINSISVAQYPFNTLIGLLMEKGYDMMYWFPTGGDDPYIDINICTESYPEYTGWASGELNTRLQDSNGILDNAARYAELASIEQSVIDEGPHIMLWIEGLNILTQDYVSGADYTSTVFNLEHLTINK